MYAYFDELYIYIYSAQNVVNNDWIGSIEQLRHEPVNFVLQCSQPLGLMKSLFFCWYIESCVFL